MEISEYKKLIPKKSHKHDEDDLQIACVKWFDFSYPRY